MKNGTAMTSQFRVTVCATWPTSVMPVNQAATGCRKLQAAERSKLTPTTLVNSSHAEIASGGVSMAARMRKTSRRAMIDAMTNDSHP